MRRAFASAAVLAGFLLGAAALAPAAQVGGVVYLDRNGNGRLDPGERGIPGVPITDGVSFVRTDAAGRYTIDATLDPLIRPGSAPILTVTFPSDHWPTAGWMRRLDREHDPKAVHFGLRPQKQTLPFLFVHGTDCHVPRGGKRLFQRFRAEVAALRGKAKLCILTGDLVSFADNYSIQRARADYSFFAAQTRDFPVPLFCTSGNHDATGTRTKGKAEPDHPLYGYGMYWKAVGPLRWSFNAAGHHFVGIDYNTVSNGQWQWGVPPGAAAWLRRDLELAPKGAPVLLFVHSPSGSTEFHHVIDDFKVQHIFCGHTHKSNVFRAGSATVWQGGALTPMIKGIPAGYRIVRITDQGVQTQYVPLGRP